MEIQQQLILTASIAYFGFTFVQPQNQLVDRVVINKVNDESKIRENFHNLFSSIAKNDRKKSETYQRILKQEVAKEQQSFDTMKEKLQMAQIRNAHKKKNYHKDSNIIGSVIANKREIQENDCSSAFDAQPTNDSWLEKDNFERMLVQQPELLRAEARKLFNECQFLKKNAQIMKDAQHDLLARVQTMDTVAHKLRTFENWELSTFGRVFKREQRVHVMKVFLKKLVKDDVRAFELAEQFRTVWGILPTSNDSHISAIAQRYSDEIFSLSNCIYKWCEHHTLDVGSMNTTYLDLAVDAGLVPATAAMQKGAVCVGYAKWGATLMTTAHAAEHTSPKAHTLHFLSETLEAFPKVSTDKDKRTFTKKAKKKKKDPEHDYYMDSGEDVSTSASAEDTTNTAFNRFTKNASCFRLPNWQS